MAADYTPTSWAQTLLGMLGMPATPSNVTAITAWEQAEGGNWGNPDRFNPLNTTQPEPGAVSTNSAGVKSYTSWDQGFAATITTLQNGHYSGILSALQRGTSAQDVVNAVLGSPWGTQAISLSGSTYTGGSSGSGSTSTVQASAPSLSDPLGVGQLETSLRHSAIVGVLAVGALALIVLGLLRGTNAGAHVRSAAGKAETAAQAGAKAGAVAA